MQHVFLFFTALFFGYILSVYISRPIEKNGTRLPNRLPRLKVKNIEFLPNFRIHYKNKMIWFHHWVYLLVFTIGMFMLAENFSQLLTVKGMAIGGIIQGLRYPDRFKFKHLRRK